MLAQLSVESLSHVEKWVLVFPAFKLYCIYNTGLDTVKEITTRAENGAESAWFRITNCCIPGDMIPVWVPGVTAKPGVSGLEAANSPVGKGL